ncbi:YfcC family protein [Salisediminibacterium halotolerans]|uniref:Uncharacterized membrane protein YfcC, ion transporter superfamily n=1 Tax=Salisediminibacterium halotolerans TaxID=517425 RepID=A0A1H9T7K3_9BACI|nr:YfcC family protein [Salisediminibacterium haloalkalitolerans]SER93151.1 Uncharacterized membrane protein YfcC, ion transporter superfamily [Salisediminibacterium haloalkalitolerans]
MNNEQEPKRKRGFQMPHIYVILFIFIIVAAVSTYFIPAGQFDEVTGPEDRVSIDPQSYQQVEQTPVGAEQFMLAIPRGLVDAGEVVFFTLIIGGLFMVLRKTGIIEVGVHKLTRFFAGQSTAVIPILMVVFAVICSIIGTQELSLVYAPVIIPLMIALRYDSIVAVAVALIATTAGFMAGFLNPINTGLAQQIADLPLYSGIEFRLTAFALILGTGIWYVVHYARKVQANPESSLVYEDDAEKRNLYLHQEQTETMEFSKKQKTAAVMLGLLFAVLIYGVIVEGWFMLEMSGLFIVMGIVVGLIAGLTATQICDGFNEGFRDVLVGAVIVGVARAVAIMMEDGQVMDTIIHNLGGAVGHMPGMFSAVGMFVVQLLFNFLVPSGSGQALVTMPIMAPLSDLIGVTRQTAVLAFQFGDGLGNILFPTSGYFMATLVLAGVSWQKWVRFYLPLFFIWTAISGVLLLVAQVIQWNGA